MKQRNIYSLLLILFANSAMAATLLNDFDPPAISLQQAIAKAKACLKDKNIEPEGYLQSAVFSPARQPNQTGKDHGRQWIMTWQRSGRVLGGATIPIIYEDDTCVITHGE